MQIAVHCSSTQKQELLLKPTNNTIEFIFFENDLQGFENYSTSVYFDLLWQGKTNIKNTKEHFIFINSVINTCLLLPKNCIRINAWPGFLLNSTIEIAIGNNPIRQIEEIMQKISWPYLLVPDEVGLVAPKVIAMIINEAYFALEENISTKEEIDVAMKLGTNYPYGPFEWAKKIGKKNVVDLLLKLSTTNNRYTPCNALLQEMEIEN